MNKRALVAGLVLLAGCKPDYLEPPDTIFTESGGGYGDTGDTDDPPNPHVCFAENAEAEAVRWQCEGFAEAALHFTMSEDAEIPDSVPDKLARYHPSHPRLRSSRLV